MIFSNLMLFSSARSDLGSRSRIARWERDLGLGGLRDELESVHREALQALKEIAFRDYARELLQADNGLRTKTGGRRLRLVQLVLKEPTSLADLKTGEAVASALYSAVTSKTLSRDLNYLTREVDLLVIKDGQVKANLDAMNQFMDG